MTPEPGTPMVPLAKALDIVHTARNRGPVVRKIEHLKEHAVPWPAPPATRDDHHHADSLLEQAWGVIANAGLEEVGSRLWDNDTEWRRAAIRWRDEYHSRLDARDDHHPAVPLSEAALAAAEFLLMIEADARYQDGCIEHAAALRAAANPPTTPARHVPVPIDDLALVLGTKIAGIRETTEARGRLRAALTAAQQDANNE